MIVREVAAGDAGTLAAIYNHYVLETIVTFEEEVVSAEDFAKRIEDVLAVPLPWLVAEENGVIGGYAYASRWRPRRGYRFSTEVTVYLAQGLGGRGFGTKLYAALIEALRALGMRNAIAGIALPNDASVALHEKLCFKKVAHFERVGVKFDRWIDVGYWQLELT